MSDQMPKLFIGGLPAGLTKGFVYKELSKFGHIVDLWIARNPPGFAFVQFDSYSDTEKAIQTLDGSTIFGPKIKVEFARSGPRKASPSVSSDDRRRSGNDSSIPSKRYDSLLPSRRTELLPYPPFSSYYGRPYDSFPLSTPEILGAAAAAASFPFHPAAYSNTIPSSSVLYPDDMYRRMQSSRYLSSRRSPDYHRRSRSPIDRRRRSNYDRYREGREDSENSSYRRGQSGSRDRRRLSPQFRRERSPPPPYRRDSPPPVLYGQPHLSFPLPSPGDEMGAGGRFHYDHRSAPSRGMPDRRGRRY
ncbi:unnamed protein product [Hymenolepis diminuta]|uniref:RRM domain-containing protein n=2 Tax=Hymenolepis diminuta TaxID=6216 RepID=A0A564XUL7_HYMDI|nr:unnamed protein product [Hymenolepis diminuta]